MAIQISVILSDTDAGVIGDKTFNLDFSTDDPEVWVRNCLNWIAAQLQPQRDLLVLQEAERIVAARRAALEAAQTPEPTE